jgi:hypothetical protein
MALSDALVLLIKKTRETSWAVRPRMSQSWHRKALLVFPMLER